MTTTGEAGRARSTAGEGNRKGKGQPFKGSKDQGSSYVYIRATPYGVDPDDTIELPRVTTILGALAKPALIGWTYKLALEGVAALASEGVALETVEKIKAALKDRSLRPYDQMQEASARGTRAHSYLETLASQKLSKQSPAPGARKAPAAVPGLPTPQDAYQESIVDWWIQVEKDLKIIGTERAVKSLQRGYAGTADLFVGRYPWLFDPQMGDGVLDLKTRKEDGQPYESEFLQLGAYWGAYLEETGRALQHTGILLARPGTPAAVFEGDPPKDFEAFCRLLEVWKWLDARA